MARVTKDEIDKFFDYDVSVSTRTIYMGSVSIDEDGNDSGVDAKMSERVLKALHLMDQSEGDITIIMNNPGGDWGHGMAIFDAIRERRNHITIKVYGYVMSMGSIILQAADERVLSKNASFMMHYGYNGASFDHALTNARWAEDHKKTYKLMEDIYLEKIKERHPRFTRKKVKDLLSFDTILTAKETVDLGLADKVEE